MKLRLKKRTWAEMHEQSLAKTKRKIYQLERYSLIAVVGNMGEISQVKRRQGAATPFDKSILFQRRLQSK